MDYQIQLRRVTNAELQPLTQAWYLDAPQQSQLVESLHGEIRVRGWLLAANELHSVKLLVKSGNTVTSYPLDQPRPDVIKKMLGDAETAHARLHCGFDIKITPGSEDMYIGFEINGTNQWARRVSVGKAVKVLEGTDGHLFLSNDTNRSIDQYTGWVLITRSEIEKWDAYLDALASLKEGLQAKPVFIVAPGKEYVFPENFPFSPGAHSPMSQLAGTFAERGEALVYPVDELKICRESSYAKGDTHWTDFGGLIGAIAALNAAGMKYDFYANMPKFSMRKAIGDLSGKLAPPRFHPAYFADFKDAGMVPVFDNGIDNHGRIWIFERAEAQGGTAVVFGDSFSKNMVPWLSLVFKRLVYVHSAAAIDPAILHIERPQAVFLQTNSRFVVNAPSYAHSVKATIAKKVGTLGASALEQLAGKVEAAADEPYKEWMQEILGSVMAGAVEK